MAPSPSSRSPTSRTSWASWATIRHLTAPNSKTEIGYAVKLDWNINENHRAALRYNKMEQNVVRFPQVSSSAISLSNFWYQQPTEYETWMGELFSDWSENFSTEFKVSHKDYSANRVPLVDMPQIRIKSGNDSLYVGTEQNTHVNIVESKELSAFGAGTWYIGDHTVKFGFDYSKNDLMNFGATSTACTNSTASTISWRAMLRATSCVLAPMAASDIPADFTLKNTGVFVQDTWAINYNLNLMFGVRIDMPDFSTQRLYNPRIEQLYGFNNTKSTRTWCSRASASTTPSTAIARPSCAVAWACSAAPPNVCWQVPTRTPA